jgi:hypothetical protein
MRPLHVADRVETSFSEFQSQIQNAGGQIGNVTYCTDLLNPFTWGGIPCAADGAIAFDEGYFGYVRWRDKGQSISHAYALTDCSIGRLRLLTPDMWSQMDREMPLDRFGRALPEAFDDLGPDGARSVILEVEQVQMTPGEEALMCESGG